MCSLWYVPLVKAIPANQQQDMMGPALALASTPQCTYCRTLLGSSTWQLARACFVILPIPSPPIYPTTQENAPKLEAGRMGSDIEVTVTNTQRGLEKATHQRVSFVFGWTPLLLELMEVVSMDLQCPRLLFFSSALAESN